MKLNAESVKIIAKFTKLKYDKFYFMPPSFNKKGDSGIL